MRSHPSHLCLAVAVAAVAAACTGVTHRTEDLRAEHGLRGMNERVALRGCVEPAPNGQGYALQRVTVLLSAEQPDAINHPSIVRGSWVRLAGGHDMEGTLKNSLNREVTITGEIRDSAVNTIGTAGRDGSAPANVANGDAPSVAVERLDKVADACGG